MWNYVEDLAILGPCSLEVLFIRRHQLHFGLLQASTIYESKTLKTLQPRIKGYPLYWIECGLASQQISPKHDAKDNMFSGGGIIIVFFNKLVFGRRTLVQSSYN